MRGLVELRLLRQVVVAAGEGTDPEAWAADLAAWIDDRARSAGTLVLDRSHVDFAAAFPVHATYVAALEAVCVSDLLVDERFSTLPARFGNVDELVGILADEFAKWRTGAKGR